MNTHIFGIEFRAKGKSRLKERWVRIIKKSTIVNLRTKCLVCIFWGGAVGNKVITWKLVESSDWRFFI